MIQKDPINQPGFHGSCHVWVLITFLQLSFPLRHLLATSILWACPRLVSFGWLKDPGRGFFLLTVEVFGKGTGEFDSKCPSNLRGINCYSFAEC